MNNVNLDLFAFFTGFNYPSHLVDSNIQQDSTTRQGSVSLLSLSGLMVLIFALINNKVVNLKLDNIYKTIVVDKTAIFYLSVVPNLIVGFIHLTMNKKLIAQLYSLFYVLLKINQKFIIYLTLKPDK